MQEKDKVYNGFWRKLGYVLGCLGCLGVLTIIFLVISLWLGFDQFNLSSIFG
ncbi:MAG: hypothetical protein ACWA5P_13475 [bacterium]